MTDNLAVQLRRERDEAIAARDAARDLAVYAMGLVDWRTPSWQVNPDDPDDEIRVRGVAIFESERSHR